MTFATLALICAVALLGPVLALTRHLRMPVVIGELVVGVALGTTGLRLLDPHNGTFAFLAEVGFALVMFIAGTHVPLSDADDGGGSSLRRGLARGSLRAVGIGLLATPLGLGLASLFGTGHGALYAVLLASSSAALVMPALGNTPLTSRSGTELVAQVVIADTACIVALPLVIQPSHAGRAALGTLAVAAVAVVGWLVLRVITANGRRRRVHDLSENRGLAIELRVTLVLLFSLATVATLMHVSVMLAGFAAGLVVSAVGEPKRVANQMFALSEGFFGPIFFVWLGASLDLRALVEHPQAIVLGVCLGVGAIAVHSAMRLTGQPLPLAVMTAAQLGLPVAATTLGTQLGVLGPGEPSALLLGALVTIAAVAMVNERAQALVQQETPRH